MAPLHPQVVALLAAARAAGLPPFDRLEPEAARAQARDVIAIIAPGPQVGAVREVRVPVTSPPGAVTVRVYDPPGPPEALVVYLHGGGWVVGSLDYVDAVCRSLALAGGCRVASVDYRLAPEHPYPVAADDAFAALRWAAEHLAVPSRTLAVAGDSAGGNLAAVCARRARDAGDLPVALQVLVYPITDHDTDTASYRAFGSEGEPLTTRELRWFWDHYAPIERRDDPDASPLRAADLSGLAPALVLLAGHDPLHDEGAAYAARLRAHGVATEVVRYDDQIHSFFPLQGVLDTAAEAVGLVARRVRGLTSPGRTAGTTGEDVP